MVNFEQGQVLVIGDVMLDSYWQGSAKRISPEAPVPVVNIDSEHARLGGAANVALNVSAIGVNAHLLGICGQDGDGDELSSLLEAMAFEADLVRCAELTTMRKLRVLSQNQQLVRLDFESAYDGFDPQPLHATFKHRLSQADWVILSDYGKGTLSDPQWYIQQCREHGVPVLIDPKGHDYQKYRGATCITPNLNEFQLVVGPCSSQDILVTKAERLRQDLGLDYLLVTQGAQGMTLVSGQGAPFSLKAEAKDVFDVTGAGDTVIAVWAGFMAAGFSVEEALHYANRAAGIVIGQVGTAAVSRKQLLVTGDVHAHWLSIADLQRLTAVHGNDVMLHYLEDDAIDIRVLAKLRGCIDANKAVVFIYNQDKGMAHCEALRELVVDAALSDHHICLTNDQAQGLLQQHCKRQGLNLVT